MDVNYLALFHTEVGMCAYIVLQYFVPFVGPRDSVLSLENLTYWLGLGLQLVWYEMVDLYAMWLQTAIQISFFLTTAHWLH